ncbi:hypothetical protein ScPMuIL_012726 [Solemya velum]
MFFGNFRILLAVLCTPQICLAGVEFQLFDEKPWKPWPDARADCVARGGTLATLKDLNAFYDYTQARNITIQRSDEVWIGGALIDKGWEWLSGEDDGEKGGGKLHEHEGCFKPAYVTGGVIFHDNSAEKCFKKCKFKGAIGLKKNICICEKDIESVLEVDKPLCNLPCEGNLHELCGGIFAISIYQANNRTVNWAQGEPKSFKACAFIRKSEDGGSLEWYSSVCETRIRYLCQFANNSKCGTENKCFRWSSSPDTWENAKKYCEYEGGQLAEVDSTQETIPKMPPTEFWIGLQRIRRWDWMDGVPMDMLSFHANSRHPNPKKTCAAVHKIKVELGFSARFCQLLRPYLCQFETEESHGIIPGTTSSVNMQLLIPSTTPAANISKTTPTGNEEDGGSNLYSILYLVVGVAVGMALVFVLGIVICLIQRCRRRQKLKRKFQGNNSRLRRDNFPVCYASNTVSLQYRPKQQEPCDVIYDSVGDEDLESPFRRTQRLLRCGSAYSWRRMPTGDSNSLRRDPYSSLGSRSIEVRTVNPYDSRMYDDVSYAIHQSLRRPCPPPYSEHSLSKSHNRKPSVNLDNQFEGFNEVIDTTYVGDLPRQNGSPTFVDSSKIGESSEEDTKKETDEKNDVKSGRIPSESDSFLNVDTSDLYACVQKVLAEVNDTINSTMKQAAARAEGIDDADHAIYSEVKK